MNHKVKLVLKRGLLCVWGAFAFSLSSVAQYNPGEFIDIEINAGNPSTPYPQFLEYAKGKNLGKYNSEGVTHADMEKAGREAYQIMSHRCRYFGGTHCGVKYLVFNPCNGGTTESSYTYPDVPHSYNTFCSEGDGYMLLASAIFADQKTFNGLYMWIHDNRFSKVERFQDGVVIRPEADCGPYLAGWGCDETTAYTGKCHSATDGDVDIAMAMLIAYKQWGEFMMQDGKVVKDFNGNPISLKEEAKRVIGALVDTLSFYDSGNHSYNGMICGDVGIDGYTKRGNSWGEVTRWRFSEDAKTNYPGVNNAWGGGPNLYSIYGGDYIDYDAPAYYNEFVKFFKEVEKDDRTDWRIHQFERAEASADWITGKAYEKGLCASLGQISVNKDDASDITFANYMDGEDFRYAWRHLLNYMWHGDPEFTWDPVSHEIVSGSNTFNKDMAERHSKLMKHPIDAQGEIACTQLGAAPDPGQPKMSGVCQVPQCWAIDGKPYAFYHTNYQLGASSPAAVLSEDPELLGDWYRACEINWNGTNTEVGPEEEERYIGSTPKYFHGWFRNLGMLTCSGNLIAPQNMVPKANVKVYMSVDKTYAYVDDDLDYVVQYRNYGSLDAEGVTIKTVIDDKDYDFVSANKGGVYDPATHTITWKIGSIPGFKTGGLDATIDSVQFRVVIKDTLNPRVCLTSTISGDNFDSWVSNEYPNHATYTMERNCVDILPSRALAIKKTANKKILNPKDVVKFTVEFSNGSEGKADWLNGGRKDVRLSYGNNPKSTPTQMYQYYRFWNDAQEAYIDLGNYRVSYFMFDAAAVGLYDAAENPTGWKFNLDNVNDAKKYGWMPTGSETKFTYQRIPQGIDSTINKKWNQRLVVQFPSSLMAPSSAVYDFLNNAYQLHKGGYGPCFFRTTLQYAQTQDMNKFIGDDWSYTDEVEINNIDGQKDTYTLVTPGWADYDNPGEEIDIYTRNTCDPVSVNNFDRVLIEEFDGYTWRRIQGRGPLPGREAYDVTIVDTIPYELEFYQWIDSTALKNDAGERIKATYTPAPAGNKSYSGIVKWYTPVMLVGEKDKLIYSCVARDLGCPDAEDTEYMNVAWISSKTDSPDSSRVEMMTTCTEVPPVLDDQTSLFKRADVKTATVGDVVNYTLSFVNTEGTTIDADCADTKDWIAHANGTVPAVSDGGLPLYGNSKTYFFSPEKAWGADGSVNFTVSGGPENTNGIYFVMRYKDGVPGQSNFRGLAIKLLINQSLKNQFSYILYENGNIIDDFSTDVTLFPAPWDSPEFRFVLKGDHLFLYINDEDNEWETVIKDWKGLKVTDPGYFGMYVNSSDKKAVLTKFVSKLDYAFDITLFDDLPEEIGNIADITGDGVWDEANKTIKWPTVATTKETALAPGDSIVYNFSADVLACNNFIYNYGHATVYGRDTLTVLNTVKCGLTECELKEVALKTDVTTICETDSVVAHATVSPKGTYYYQYFKDGEPFGNLVQKMDSVVIKEAGKYFVKVYLDKDTVTEPVCMVKSKAITIAVDTLPKVVLSDTSACSGKKIDLLATEANNSKYSYLWSNKSNSYHLLVDKDGEYSVVVTNGECVVKDTAIVKFGAASLTDGVFTLGGVDYDRDTYDSAPMCPGVDGTLSVNYVADDDKYTWTSDPVDATMVADGNSITMSPTVDTKYYVSFVKGCEAIDSFTVKIGEPMAITTDMTVLCDSVKITASTTESASPVFHWSLDGGLTEDIKPYFVSNDDYSKGTVSVYATADDACTSEVVKVPFQNTSMTAVIDGTPSVCPNNSADITILPTTTGMATAPAYTYQWLDDAKQEIAGETSSTLTATGGSVKGEVVTYYGVVSNGVCKDTIEHKITTGNGEIKGEFSVNDSVIYGSPKKFGYCDDVLNFKADYVSDGAFEWQVDGVVQSSTDNTLSFTPTADKAVITLKWVNVCDAFDTIIVTKLPNVDYTIATVPQCGSTTISMTAVEPATGMHYYWKTSANDEYEGVNYVATLDMYPSTTGTADIVVKAKDYCPVIEAAYPFSIDTLGVELTADQTVCYNTAVKNLDARFTSSNTTLTDQDITYTYGYRLAGTNNRFVAIDKADLLALPLTDDTEIQVTATDGICTATDTWIVTIGTPARDGVLTVDDAPVAPNAQGVKSVRTCGDDPVVVEISHTADAGSYSWAQVTATADVPVGSSTNSLTVSPDVTAGAHVERYVVSFTNECPLSDTIDIEVYPLNPVADWTTGEFDVQHCEGESASVTLSVDGFDPTAAGSYIHWFIDDQPVAKYDNKTSISLPYLSDSDNGTYRYEVSNGVCVKPATADQMTLVVKPLIMIGAISNKIVVPRESDTTIALSVVPAEADFEWTDALTSTVVANGNPLVLTNVQQSMTLNGVASATGYCPTELTLNIVVDAKPVVSLSVSESAICYGDEILLTADTTGTGQLLNEKSYKITYYMQDESGVYYQLNPVSAASFSAKPLADTKFKAVVTYGKQIAESEEIAVKVFQKATYDIVYKDSVCAGEPVQISIDNLVPSDAVVVWNADPTLQGAGLTATATPDATTVYGFTITQNNGVCSQSDNFKILASEPVEVQMMMDPTICIGDRVQLYATIHNGNPNYYKWTVDGSDSILSTNVRFYVRPTETTTYKFEAGDGVCSSSSEIVVVNVAEKPEIVDIVDAGIKMRQLIVAGGTPEYEYAVQGFDYQFSDIVTYKTYGVHTLVVKDANGCMASTVDTLQAPAIHIPSVITPNGDGENDLFAVPGMAEAFPDSKITIFDRYGKVIAQYRADEGGWDGTYNGKRLPSTDYWYEIYVYEIRKTYTGHFTLLNDQ